MSKTNITIIGCGWLGLPLAEKSIKSDFTVYGSSRNKEKLPLLKEKGIKPFHFELLMDSEVPAEIIRFTDVLVLTIPPIKKTDITYFGRCLANLCGQFSERTEIVFFSSTGVYPHKSGSFDEKYIFSTSEKQTCLFQTEHALKVKLGSRLTILRLGGLIGPKRHPVFLLEGKTDVQNPDGPVNLVHQLDVVEFVLNLVEFKRFGGIVNLTHPEHPSRKEFYTEASQLRDLKPITFKDSTQLKRKISSKKAMERLGFDFVHNIRHVKNSAID